jgi:hypothetical protein
MFYKCISTVFAVVSYFLANCAFVFQLSIWPVLCTTNSYKEKFVIFMLDSARQWPVEGGTHQCRISCPFIDQFISHQSHVRRNPHQLQLNSVLGQSSSIIVYIQGRTGHSSNATLVAGTFTIFHTKCQENGGFLGAF